jgi:hypothetical protein
MSRTQVGRTPCPRIGVKIRSVPRAEVFQNAFGDLEARFHGRRESVDVDRRAQARLFV